MRSAALMLLTLGLAASSRAEAQQPQTNPHGPIEDECTTCHSAEAWVPARISSRFDHAKFGMALTGAHLTAKCSGCHTSLEFTNVPRECLSCHKDVHQGTLGTDCLRCHTSRSFLDRSQMVRMHQTTRFPLAGAHIATDCETCHVPSAQGAFLFAASTTNCIDCHINNYRTALPDHVAGAYNPDCTQCHTLVSWAGAKFDHNSTRFPLTGGHKTLACTECHASGVYAGKNTVCISCHQPDYDATTNPPHQAAAFPTDCVVCHTTKVWTGATFNHNTTKYPLVGAHRTVACQQCHGDGVFAGKSTVCVSCHQLDYTATTNPPHQASGFPTDCAACHQVVPGWAGATFNHSQFSLNHEGARGVCTECHTTTNYLQSTCSTHHHPPTCTYLNQRNCDD